MVFAMIYNLAKNAAKANVQIHYQEEDQALSKLYNLGDKLEHPRHIYLKIRETGKRIIISVRDLACGMSMDEALKRMHDAIVEQLEDKTPDEIRKSQWYCNIRRQIGQQQAELLITWPRESEALRKIKVGTIFDCQFVAGFGKGYWRLNSNTSGLGLWGVRYVTETLGGTVMATNSFEGGAEFTISLPKNSVLDR